MRVHALTLTAVATTSLTLLALIGACEDGGTAPASAPPTTAPARATPPADEPETPAPETPEDYFDELGDDVDLENAEATLDDIRKELEAEEAGED